MELHQVRYFLALARTLNFTSAADASHVTQPALSKAIQKLEHELGGELLHRDRLSTQLTDFGRHLLPMLESMGSAVDAASAKAREFRTTAIAPLRIGLSPTVSPSIISSALSQLARKIPALKIDLVTWPDAGISERLLDGDLHAGVVGARLEGRGRIDHFPLRLERYVALVSAAHPFAQMAVIPRNRLKEAAWLELDGSDEGDRLGRLCFEDGGAPILAHRGHQDSHLQHMAAAGLGIMLAPEHTPRVPGLLARPIEGDPIQRTVELAVIAGRQYSPALFGFIKLARVASLSPERSIPQPGFQEQNEQSHRPAA